MFKPLYQCSHPKKEFCHEKKTIFNRFLNESRCPAGLMLTDNALHTLEHKCLFRNQTYALQVVAVPCIISVKVTM